MGIKSRVAVVAPRNSPRAGIRYWMFRPSTTCLNIILVHIFFLTAYFLLYTENRYNNNYGDRSPTSRSFGGASYSQRQASRDLLHLAQSFAYNSTCSLELFGPLCHGISGYLVARWFGRLYQTNGKLRLCDAWCKYLVCRLWDFLPYFK